MVFEYNIKVPLTYNHLSIQTNVPDSELYLEIIDSESDFGVVFKTYEIPNAPEGYDLKTTVTIKLYQAERNAAKAGKKGVPKYICEIRGMLVDDEFYARKFAEEILDKICKELSMVFIRHNGNRHLFQPRVEPLWSGAVFDRHEYPPFIDIRRKALEECDGKHKTIILEDYVYFTDSLYSIISVDIPDNEINIHDWLLMEDDGDYEFLLNEYYSALGTEKNKSKFFHLFSIIEFCEKAYTEHNGAKDLISDEEFTKIIDAVEEQSNAFVKDKKDRVLGTVKGDLKKMTDINRAKKLRNILNWMGIHSYSQFGVAHIIDESMLKSIIELRNKSFHGTKEDREKANSSYIDANQKLLHIDEQIIAFARANVPSSLISEFLICGQDTKHGSTTR